MSDQPDDAESKIAKPAAESSGWRVVDFGRLKNPPDWLASAVYGVAALGLIFIIYMLGLGLVAFVRLGHEIASTAPTVVPPTASPPAPKGDGSGSLTVFFTVLGALIGGPLIIWRVITAHVQAQAARHQAETAREGHYTDLFTKAVEQLGATREVKETIETDDAHGALNRETITKTEPNLEVRLGAIYALDRVARDSERDHWPIMRVLCAYVRNPQNCDAPVPRPENLEPGSNAFRDWVQSLGPPRVDVQAVLTVIGERPEVRRKPEASRHLRLDLQHANLQRAMLVRSHFELAIFDGADLAGARFTDAHLDGAWFNKAHLDGAWFNKAHLDGAWFVWAHLDGAGFDGAHLDGAAFADAHLDNARFAGAHLDSARFAGAHLDGVVFFNADLSKIRSLNLDMLASAFGDASTKLPDGIERPATWPDRELSWAERNEWREKARGARPNET